MLSDADRAKLEAATYLGDGLYASYDGYQIELMASNGVSIHDTVYLEPRVYSNLTDFVKKVTSA